MRGAYPMDSMLAPVDKSTTAGRALPLVNLASFVLVIVINAISSIGAISKLTIGEVSDLYGTLVTPAGYAFSIWGIIYFAIAVFVIWQAIPSVRDEYLVFDRIGYWFSASCLFNVIWIAVFVQATPVAWIWVSSVFLFLIFGSLLAIVLRVDTWARALVEINPTANNFTEFSDDRIIDGSVPARSIMNIVVTYFAVDFAFSIYCGWTTVASILNVSLSLVGSDFYGNGHQDAWAIAILVIAAVIFLGMVVLKWNWAYGFVFTWAAVAIAKKAKSTSCADVAEFDDAAGCTRVQHTALTLATIVGVVAAFRLFHFIYAVVVRRKTASPSRSADTELSVPAQ